MKLLTLETSTKRFSLAVSDGEAIAAARSMRSDRVLSARIIPAIQAVLKKCGLRLADMDGIAVGLGPGSFTGLRVGVATAKGLAHALNKPLIGIPSLDAAAMNVRKGTADQICVVFDARRGLVYAAVYDCFEDGIGLVSDYMLTDVQSVLKRLKGDVVFLGDGVALYQKVIEEKGCLKTAKFTPVFLKETGWFPSAKHVSALARRRFCEGDFDSIVTLVPLYLYPDDCQVRH